MPGKIVEINTLTKVYSRRRVFSAAKVLALDGITLDILKGDCFGLLGPNGAGKSTTLNIISGLLKATSGQINVFGRVNKFTDKSFKSKIGYLPEENNLPGYLSLESLLQFLAKIFGLSGKERQIRIPWLIEQFELKDSLKKSIRLLSSGKRRSVGLACALINDPELLILDEPTVYLDPLQVKNLRDMLLDLKKRGKTIIISSHILSEIEKLCNRIAILKGGKLKFFGESQALIDKGNLDEAFIELISD